MNVPVPAISVIIPMYNAERYIGACLDSVLSQTFKDFEVIVVDDLSTDRSVEIVKNIAAAHPVGREGCVHLIKRQKHSGGMAVPRNIGMRASHGKFITFLDSEDMITHNAFITLYELAESTDADVLHAQRFLTTNDDRPKPDASTRLEIKSWEQGSFVTEPELISFDIGERIKLYTQMRLLWNVWNKLFRRDFLMSKCIDFPDIKIIDDMMFCFKCFCLAKNYVRIPTIYNLCRASKNARARRFSSWDELFHQSLGTIKDGTKILDEFMSGMDYFNRHGEFKHMAIDFFVQSHLNQTIELCNQLPPHVIEALLKREFLSDLEGNAALLSYLFRLANVQHRQIASLQAQLNASKK